MAQGDEGASRKSKTYRDFSGMNSQNERYKIGDDEFFWMENIMRVGPRKLHSVPGPKQIAVFPQPLSGCPPDTPPGNQGTLTDKFCYNYNTGLPPGSLVGNSAGQVSFIGDGPEFYATVGNQDSFGTDYTTNTGVFGPFGGVTPMFQLIHAVGNTMSLATPVPIPPADIALGDTMLVVTQPAQFGNEGKSDGFGYEIADVFYTATGRNQFNAYFDIQNQTIAFFGITTPGINGSGYWTKFGDFYYVADQSGLGIYKWQVSTGIGRPTISSFNDPLLGPVGPVNPDGHRFYQGIQATANFLWAWWYNLPDGSKIYKMDHDGNLIQTFTLNLASVISIGSHGAEIPQIDVVNDDLIYILTGNTAEWDIVYLETGDSSLHLAATSLNPGCVATDADFGNGMNQFFFHKGYFYLSYGGFAFGGTNVLRLGVLFCPTSNIPIGQ